MQNLESFKNKNILVAGGSGFIGSNLIKALTAAGLNVTATLHKSDPQINNALVKYIKCDLTRFEECRKVTKGIDYVFMLAANSSGAQVIEENPLAHLTPNILMNTSMLEASRINEIKRFCFISSNTVYPETNEPVSEADVNFSFHEKYFVVGWMKVFSEIMCNMHKEKASNSLDTLIIRPGNLYGPYDKFSYAEAKVVPALIRRAIEKNNPFEVWGDGLDLKDFLFIDDFISGLLSVFLGKTKNGPINIASGNSISIKEIVPIILRHAGHKNATVTYDISKPQMIPKRLINVKKIKKLTGWKASTSIENGIEKTIKWYKETLVKQ